MAIKGDFGVVRSLHAKSRFLKIVSVRRYDSESFVGEQTAETRVNTHIHICMYLCRCDNMFHPGHFIISQLLSFCISSTAASNSTVFYTSIEILIWLSPLCCARVCLSQTTYQRDRSPSITASLPAFVNPCCAIFASRRYREAFCSPSQTQLRLLLIFLVDLALSFFLFLYFYFSLYLSLQSFRFVRKEGKIYLSSHLSRENGWKAFKSDISIDFVTAIPAFSLSQ